MQRKEGFSLLEFAVVLGLSALLISVVMPGYYRTVQAETARNTAAELSRVSEAVRAYRIERREWPADLAAVQSAGYLPAGWSRNSPFGRGYSLVPASGSLSILTWIPAEMTDLVCRLTPLSFVSGTEVGAQVMAEGSAPRDVPVGSILPWPSAIPPSGWMLCDGQPVSRTDHAELWAVIGTVYGSGDGSTTFNLPDLRGRTVVGADNMGGSAANIILDPAASIIGGRFGESRHMLTAAEMPAHVHNMSDYTFSENMGWGGSSLGNAESLDYDNIPSVPYWHPTDSAGGGQAHNNIQPSLTMVFIIRAS